MIEYYLSHDCAGIFSGRYKASLIDHMNILTGW